MRNFPTIFAAACLGACATHPDQIRPDYVSPFQYQGLACGQISAERMRVGISLQGATDGQRIKATADATTMAIGLFVFWPMLFMVGSGQDLSSEVAKLRGEDEALRRAAEDKGCNSAAPPLEAGATPATAPAE